MRETRKLVERFRGLTVPNLLCRYVNLGFLLIDFELDFSADSDALTDSLL